MRWLGVVKVDLLDGPPSIITVGEASQRQKLAALGDDFHRGEAGSLSGSGHAGRGTKKERRRRAKRLREKIDEEDITHWFWQQLEDFHTAADRSLLPTSRDVFTLLTLSKQEATSYLS